MEVAKSSSQSRKYLKYSTSTATANQQSQLGNIHTRCKWNIHILLTSHAIVGEALAELIDNNEEDAKRVTADHFILKISDRATVFTEGGDAGHFIHNIRHRHNTTKLKPQYSYYSRLYIYYSYFKCCEINGEIREFYFYQSLWCDTFVWIL